MSFPMLWVWLPVLCGIVTAEVFHFAPWGWALGLLFVLVSVWVRLRQHADVAIVALLGMLLLGGWRAAWEDEQHQFAASLPLPEKMCTQVDALLAPAWRIRIDAPVVRITRSEGVQRVEVSELSQRTMATLIAMQCGSRWLPITSGRVHVLLKHGDPVVRGDLIQVRLRVQAWEKPHNPTDADMHLWVREHGLTHRAMVTSAHVIVQPSATGWGAIDRWRHRAEQRMEQQIDPRVLGLAKALALGDFGDISRTTRDAWADAGASHLLSVSGLHVGMLATLVYGLLTRALGRTAPALVARTSLHRVSAWITLPILILYCVVTGGAPATVRSTWMAGAYFTAVGLGQRASAINSLGLAGVIMLLLAPFTLYDAGFLLSFLGVAALLVWPSSNNASASSSALSAYALRAVRWVRTMIVLSCVATCVSAPVTALYFGKVSLAGVWVNLVAVPVGTWIATPLALGYVLCAPVLERWHATAVFARPLAWVLGALDGLVAWAAQWSWSSMHVPTPTPWEICLFAITCIGIWGICARVRWQRLMRISTAFGLTAMLMCIGWRYWQQRPDGTLTVMFAYVGQGDGAIMRLPQGGIVVIDGGGVVGGDAQGWEPGEKVMAPLLRSMNVDRIDLMILTHPHPDHYGGLLYLTAHFPVSQLWWTGEAEDMPAQRQLKKNVEQKGGRVFRVAELPPVHEREGVRFEIWHPRPYVDGAPMNEAYSSDGLPYYPVLSTNDNSVTLRVVYGNRSLLMTGDIEHDAEAVLGPMFTQAGLGNVDILKVPHHGSRTSSTDALLAAVHPKMAVLSCGVNNVFHFPHPTVLDRYRAYDVEVWRTDQEGMITAKTDGKTWQVNGFRRQREEN